MSAWLLKISQSALPCGPGTVSSLTRFLVAFGLGKVIVVLPVNFLNILHVWMWSLSQLLL